MNGRIHIYLAGEASYKDSVTQPVLKSGVTNPSLVHVTQFALEFMIDQLDAAGGGLGGAAAQLGPHNCADDGCPK
jgi:hypothetical protein